MEIPVREIELARLMNAGGHNWWDTVCVEIPATTHPSKVEEVAIAEAIKRYGECMYCIYNTYDDEVPEVKGAFIVEMQDDALCVQRFLVTDCADEEEALGKIYRDDCERYGPDERVKWIERGNASCVVKPHG